MKYLAFVSNGKIRQTINLGDCVSQDEALIELQKEIVDSYPKDSSGHLVNGTLYEISKAWKIDLEKIYENIEEQERLNAQKEEEEKERALYEELKKKFEGKD